MVNLANINLGKDLAKLPLAERLNIIMHFRAADYLDKPTPISRLEYDTLDASIRTNEEIRAYNKANNAFHKLLHQFDYVVKCVIGVQITSHHFKLIWVANRQAEFMLDGVSCFLYQLQEKLEETKESKPNYEQLIADCITKFSPMLFHDCEVETDSEGCGWLIAKLRKGDFYQQKVEELNAASAKLEAEIAEYHELAESSNLHLSPFTNTIPSFIAEAKDHIRWLERLNSKSN